MVQVEALILINKKNLFFDCLVHCLLGKIECILWLLGYIIKI